MQNVYSGNVIKDGAHNKGWFVGQFIDEVSLRHQDDVELKWGVHQKGETRDEWSVTELATTMSLIIKGQMRVTFEDGEVVLNEGDYYISEPKVAHKYSIEQDSVVLTMRWPSRPKAHQNISK